MSDLLKMSKARDDQDFVWRITAAMMVHSHRTQFSTELSDLERQLTDWVLANPMVPLPTMVNYVCTSLAILPNVTVDSEGVWSAAGVPDTDIQFVVGESWADVSRSLFGTVPG